MVYAKQHLSRLDLHHRELAQTPHGVYTASVTAHDNHTPVRLQDMIDTQRQQQLPRGGSGSCRSNFSRQRNSGSGGPALDAHDGSATELREGRPLPAEGSRRTAGQAQRANSDSPSIG
nr:unnamed protein product [Leishmania braziliensis]CAJ2480428.1 unnamed protein product [Leishmania braziliensis]